MKNTALFFYFFLAPVFVYIAGKTSWLDHLPREYFVYYGTIFLTGTLFSRTLSFWDRRLMTEDTEMKSAFAAFIFMISAISSALGLILFVQDSLAGHGLSLLLASLALILGAWTAWLLRQHRRFDGSNLFHEVIGCELTMGSILGAIGFCIPYFHYHDFMTAIHSNFFVWLAIIGCLAGGLMGILDCDEDTIFIC